MLLLPSMFSSAPIRLSPSFSWHVAVEGYRLHTIRFPIRFPFSEPFVSPEGYELEFDEDGKTYEVSEFRQGERCIAPKADCSFETRKPLEDSSLFLSFANLECTERAVAKFVRRHGLLSHGPTSRCPPEADGRLGRLEEGESLEHWYEEVRSLRLGIGLWNASRADSERTVQELVADPQYDKAWQQSGGEFLSETVLPALLKKGQVQTPEDALHVAHAIALTRFDEVEWRFTRTLPKNRHVLELSPNSLASALWMQFACAMASDAKYRRCEYEGCRGFFDADTTRRSRRYCSNSCKTRAYNKRHALGATRSASKPAVSGDR